jgi:hypothetical protein
MAAHQGSLLLRIALASLLMTALADRPAVAGNAPCRCQRAKKVRCPDPAAKHRLTVRIDLDVVDGAVQVITQSGPYRVPVADLDGKLVLFLLTPRGEVFQGFFGPEAVLAIGVGTMQGAQASIPTDAVFAPGEYELALFIDVVSGGGLGPQRGDLAAFDNGTCDPTGVSVRVPVGCEDATVTLTNHHFIIF